jgi:uncharacterized phage protein gp47/JayE
LSSERRKPGPKTRRSTAGYGLKVYLSTAEEARLDRYCTEHGISRAQAVRDGLEALYREERGTEMASVYYIQTSDPERVIRVPSAGLITVEPAEQFDLDFHLVNTLNAKAMGEARQVARSAGLTLRDPERVARAAADIYPA